MSRGGARRGAGRKAPRGKRLTVTIRVLPETKEKMVKLREDGTHIGELVDAVIAEKFAVL